MLHLTNGDHAADVIRALGLPGEVVPWRDVLHEGPVPAGLAMPELSAVRARFVAASTFGGRRRPRSRRRLCRTSLVENPAAASGG